MVSSPLMPLIDCKLANTFVEQELMIISRREALKYLKRLHSKVKHVRIRPAREKMGARVSSDPLEQNQSLWNTGAGSIPYTLVQQTLWSAYSEGLIITLTAVKCCLSIILQLLLR